MRISSFGPTLTVPLLSVMAGCLSFDASHPLVIAPTAKDWNQAYSRLDPSAQEILARGTGLVAAPNTSLDGTIYNLRYGPPSKGVEFERLDVATIAAGYDRAFKTNSADRWEIAGTMTQMQITAPDGYQRQFFQLDWRFTNSKGKVWEPSGEGQGDGVNIKWGNHEPDLVRDANVAFAEAFLRMMARSKSILKENP
jgi:hypothetical protein